MASLFNWGARKADRPVGKPLSTGPAADALVPSKVLPKALAVLAHVSSPVLLDLGPVTGSNVSFFGEHLGCTIRVEDLFAEVERHTRQGTRSELAQSLPARLQYDAASVDGILCWDLFDYLDKPSGQALAAHLVRLLKPGGLLYGFFGAGPAELTHYTRFTVESASAFRLRTTPATPIKRHVLVVRDLNRLFDGLQTSESVLLRSNARETLFRKIS